MTPEEQAQALARWLEEPAGSTPPALDPDVVESVYALRPELAPAPRVSVDDILGAVTAGPLAPAGAGAASPEGEGGDVVPFPGAAPDPVPDTVPAAPARKNWWRAANQWGGFSAIIATAATLVVIALPVLQMESAGGPAAEMATAEEAPAAAPAAPEGAPAPALAEAQADAPAPSPKPATSRAAASKTKPAAAPIPPSAVARQAPADPVLEDAVADLGDEVGGDYYDMDEDRAQAQEMIIPEASAAAPAYAGEPSQGYALDDFGDLPEAEEEGEAISKPSKKKDARKGKEDASDEAGAAVRDDLTQLRNAAVTAGWDAGWRDDLDGSTLAKIDVALRSAQMEARGGNYRAAGDQVVVWIIAPASAGQVMAIEAGRYYLDGDASQQAIAAVQRGLQLSQESTARRAMLEVLYGDALMRVGDYAGAEAAYRRASGGNTKR